MSWHPLNGTSALVGDVSAKRTDQVAEKSVGKLEI